MFEDLENKPTGDNKQVNNPNTPLLGSLPSEAPVNENKTKNFALTKDEGEQAMSDFEERLKGLYDKGQKRGKKILFDRHCWQYFDIDCRVSCWLLSLVAS